MNYFADRDRWRDLRLHGQAMRQRQRAGLVVNGVLPEPFERSVLGKYELQRINDAGFAVAVWRENCQTALLAEIELLRLKKGSEPYETEGLEEIALFSLPYAFPDCCFSMLYRERALVIYGLAQNPPAYMVIYAFGKVIKVLRGPSKTS